MIELDYYRLERFIKQEYPTRIGGIHVYRYHQANRWIQINTPFPDVRIHYECIQNGIELHFENGASKDFNELLDKLIRLTKDDASFVWKDWGQGYRCQYNCEISSFDEYCERLKTFVSSFDKLFGMTPLREDDGVCYEEELSVKPFSIEQSNTVVLEELSLREVMQLPLSIPDYQRDYCWDKEYVECLLNDISKYIISSEKQVPKYRLGTLILYYNTAGKCCDIIDGQQRLITLALLLQKLKLKTGLLQTKFTSKTSQDYIAYNKYLLSLCTLEHKDVATILDCVEFSVLILQDTSLDLAYTFFSNQNSRGVPLTDYDLLKAHHLRYIPSSYERQARRTVKEWNTMIEHGQQNASDDEQPDYVRLLDTYIYHLRHWMRKRVPDEQPRHIKKEYQSAPLMDELPPFGETFHFNTPIQGGTHFFAFVEQQLTRYTFFSTIPQVIVLHNTMRGRSQQWYRDAIEGLLFGYYLKFGTTAITDALILIMRIIVQHRYTIGRARKLSIMQYAADTELIMMIEQASSPTFFLAEAYKRVQVITLSMVLQDFSPIQREMYRIVQDITDAVKQTLIVEAIKKI